MSEIIVNGTIEVLAKALKNFAEKDAKSGVTPKDVQLVIALSDVTVKTPTVQNPIRRTEGTPFYSVLKDFQPWEKPRKLKDHPTQILTNEVTFLNMLGDPLADYFGFEARSAPFLQEAIVGFTNEINTQKRQALLDAGTAEAEIPDVMVNPFDVEIIIMTPTNDPIKPIPFLYYEGQEVRQLLYGKDIFKMDDVKV